MPKTIQIGGIDRSTFFVEDFALPIQETVALSLIRDAVDQAAQERKAVAVVGPKGAGKSIAVARVRREFDQVEQEIQEADAKYRPRRFVIVQSSRSPKPLEVLSSIWKAVLGSPAPLRRRGKTVSEDELRDKLIEILFSGNVAILAFDEAENLDVRGLEVIRDLISVAESTSKARFSGDSYAATGVGVVLLGTEALEPTLHDWEELGHRVLRVVHLPHLEDAEVADLYRAFLPSLNAHAEEVGDDAWVDWVRQEITAGKPFPVRAVENHIRAYVRRMAEQDPEVSVVEDVPFDVDLFLYTLNESALALKHRAQAAR